LTKSVAFRSLFNKTFWISAVFLVIKTLLSEGILILNSSGFRLTLFGMQNYSITRGVVIFCLEMLVVLLFALLLSRFSLLSKSGGMTLLFILFLTDWTYTVFEVIPQVFFYYDFYEYLLHTVAVMLFIAAVFSLFGNAGRFVVPAVVFVSITVSVSSLFSIVPSLVLLSRAFSLSKDSKDVSTGVEENHFKKVAGASAIAAAAGLVFNYLFVRFVYAGYSNGNKLLPLNLLNLNFRETGKAFLCCLPVMAFCLYVCLRSRNKRNKAAGNKILSLVVLSYTTSIMGAFFCNNFWFLTTVSITPLMILMISCSDGFVMNEGAEVANSVERVDSFFKNKPYFLVLIILLMYASATLSVTGNSSIL